MSSQEPLDRVRISKRRGEHIVDTSRSGGRPLETEAAVCSICETNDRAVQIAEGEDYEYGSSPDTFRVFECRRCDTRFLNPRPVRAELSTIYPATYHAFEFTEDSFGLTYGVRRRLEGRRLLDWCSSVPRGGSIVDVGCGDGFHLRILDDVGDPTWTLEGIEPDPKAAQAARAGGFEIHQGFVEDLDLEPNRFDFAIMIMVVEHLDDPVGVLRAVGRLLRPGGGVGIITDNIRSLDASFGKSRYWGGYHFPRHFHLYSERSLADLAVKSGFEVERIGTTVSPVNWTYTVHNYLEDHDAPGWLRRLFTLESPLALSAFTALDAVSMALGRGALLRAVLRKPA